jgi:pSer/pThr/pTyr-binding forkhead associated (FHA) protein
MQAEQPGMNDEEEERPVAFLVVDGTRVIPLDQPVTNIGRKSDNHIVIKNEHVSRYHAQIRAYKGTYVLLDLNSTVGTSVNGSRINQVALRPGDVISLGGVPIIFGLGIPKDNLDQPGNSAKRSGDSTPTKKTAMESADKYLDLFDSTGKQEK